MSEPLKNSRGAIVRDRDGRLIATGERIAFSTPRNGKLVEGDALRWRRDPRNLFGMGFVDVKCVDNIERSARPTQCFKPAHAYEEGEHNG